MINDYNYMTLREQFESLKQYGYVCDNKTDANGNEHSGENGQFVKKGGGQTSSEKKEDNTETKNEDPKVDDKGYPFEKTSSGDVNFGEVTQEMADAMGTGVAAPIRFSSGNSDYGKKHLEEWHMQDIYAYNYDSSNEFVEDIAKNFDEIYQGKQEKDEAGNITRNTFILAIHKTNAVLYIELRKAEEEDYYSVNSGGIINTSRYAKTKEKNRIWNRPTTDSQVADTLAGVNACPLYVRNETSKAAAPTNSSSNIAHDHAEVKSLKDIYNRIKGL